MVEHLVHLATWMPFTPAGAMLGRLLGVAVSAATARRRTEEAGAAYVAIQTAEVAALERETPPAPAGPALQQVSVDGAMVPLVGGEWAEVKTLAIGTVGERVGRDGERQVQTRELSYFSRLADRETFGRLATVETHRRGTETAGTVVAVVDGAEWEQEFINLHCPAAVRILDWGHASAYVVKAGQALFGAGTAAASEWLAVQLRELREGDPEAVLAELRSQQERLAADGGASEVREVVADSLTYLEKRREQIRYAACSAKGYPIGSGAVESANKLVVEARLKGSGMHWARGQVNPMVALRTAVCSDRWDEAWEAIAARWRQDAQARRRVRCVERRRAKTVAAPPPPVMAVAARAAAKPGCKPQPKSAPAKPAASAPRRPAADHPWRRMPIGRARMTSPRQSASAKL